MSYPEQTPEELKAEQIRLRADVIEKQIDDDQAERGDWFWKSIQSFLRSGEITDDIIECLDSVIDDCDNQPHEPINRFLHAARRWEAERVATEEINELEKSIQP